MNTVLLQTLLSDVGSLDRVVLDGVSDLTDVVTFDGVSDLCIVDTRS